MFLKLFLLVCTCTSALYVPPFSRRVQSVSPSASVSAAPAAEKPAKISALKEALRKNGKSMIITFIVGELSFSAACYVAAYGVFGLLHNPHPAKAALGFMVIAVRVFPAPLRVACYAGLHPMLTSCATFLRSKLHIGESVKS